MKPLLVLMSFLLVSAVWATEPATAEKNKPDWLERFSDQEELFSIDGYRLLRYRSPTPLQAEGGRTISTGELQALLAGQQRPALLNVQPLRWQQGFFLLNEPFLHIPGSRWIPNVGLGELEDGWEHYFRHHLAAVTGGEKSAAVVIYCRADCWMSWNAVKRAASWGYTNLYWYRDGVDGWREADLELIEARPEPYPVASTSDV
jgi:PQQ-dependent catabolism-associated CXXCW motif protein